MKAEQLRKSILQLAIQGKLVKQDPNDEPASVLLERIRAEKQRLIKEGKIKKDKGDSIIFKGDDNCHYEKIGSEVKNIEDEIPFELPDNWCWVRHNSLFEIFGGSQPPKSKFSAEPKDGYIRLYQIRDYGPNPVPVYIPIETAHKTTQKGDILLARYGASLGKVFWAEDGAYNVAMAKVEKLFVGSHICNEYLYVFYKSYLYQNLVLNNSRSAQAGFNKEDLESLFFPVPPFSEQERIVEALSKFEPLLESYTNLEKQASFLDSEIYDKLKKSILQYAIQGKLVEQDENDEPASVLLERIRAEKKSQLGKKYVESYIYKGDDNCYYEKIGDIIKDISDEIPFDIPKSWSWVRLNDICDYIHRGKSPTYGSSKILPIIAQKCNQWDKIYTDRCLFAEEESIERYTNEQYLRIGDIIINSTGTGTVGRTGFIEDYVFKDYDKFVADSHVTVVRANNSIISAYIYLFLISPQIQRDVESKCAGSTNQIELATNTIKNYLLPLPPAREQEKIVNVYHQFLNKIKDEN